MGALARDRLPLAGLLALAVAASLVAGAAIRGLPTPVVVAVPLGLALAAVGLEALIAVAWMAALGLLPFVEPERTVGGVPLYVLGFVVASGLMLLGWAYRRLVGRPFVRLRVTPVLAVALALLVYALVRLGAGRPQDVPSLSAPFVMFPLGILVCAIWAMHPAAFQGIRRALPLIIGLLLLWSVAYVLGATGHCGGCERLVGAGSARQGLLGGGSRLFTDGQNAMLAILLATVAVGLRRPSTPVIALGVAATVALALQASRAQYAGVLVGLVVLLWWRFRFSTARGRALLVVLAAVAVVLLVTSPVGHRGLSAVSELSQGSGNGGYRLGLLAEQRQHFSVFGSSVTLDSLNLGINFDLGVSNTVIVLGYVGAALQLVLVVLALWAGWRTGNGAGAALAAVAAMVLATRFSLPLLETGPSAAAYGLAFGLAAVLPGRAPPGRA